MKVRISLAALAVTALVAAGCGSSNSSSSSSSGGSATQAASGGGSKSCSASLGIEAPLTGQVSFLGQEQLAFAKLAIQDDNKANGTNITLVQGDTQLMPAQATTAISVGQISSAWRPEGNWIRAVVT